MSCVQLPRHSRPTAVQKSLLADFLEKYPNLARGRLTGEDGNRRASRLWATISERLNASEGCYKTWKQWRKYWTDKKINLRKLAVQARKDHITIGGVPSASFFPVDQLDMRMLALINTENQQDVKPVIRHKTQDAVPKLPEVKVEPQLHFEFIGIAPAPPRTPARTAITPVITTDNTVRCNNQSGYLEIRKLIEEHGRTHSEDIHQERDLRRQEFASQEQIQRQQLELQQQQLELQRQQLELKRDHQQQQLEFQRQKLEFQRQKFESQQQYQRQHLELLRQQTESLEGMLQKINRLK